MTQAARAALCHRRYRKVERRTIVSEHLGRSKPGKRAGLQLKQKLTVLLASRRA